MVKGEFSWWNMTKKCLLLSQSIKIWFLKEVFISSILFKLTLQATVKDIKLVEPSRCHTLYHLICIEKTVFAAHTIEMNQTFVWRRTTTEGEEEEDIWITSLALSIPLKVWNLFTTYLKIKSCQYWSFSFHKTLIVFMCISTFGLSIFSSLLLKIWLYIPFS